MKLKTWVGTSSALMSDTFAIGQWVTIYVSYSLTQGLYGVSFLFINEGIYQTFTSVYTAPNSTALSTLDTVKIGEGFIGQLRRMQIYSPGSTYLNKGSRKFPYIKENYSCLIHRSVQSKCMSARIRVIRPATLSHSYL